VRNKIRNLFNFLESYKIELFNSKSLVNINFFVERDSSFLSLIKMKFPSQNCFLSDFIHFLFALFSLSEKLKKNFETSDFKCQIFSALSPDLFLV